MVIANPAVDAVSKVLWLRAKDVSATSGSVDTWTGQVGVATPYSTPAPTISSGATPSGGKAITFSGGGAYALGDLGVIPASTFVATASSLYGAGYEGSNVVDGNLGNCWVAASPASSASPQWLRLQTGVATVATSYEITDRGGWPDHAPTAWTFQGSNDGTTWALLDTRSAEVWTGSQQTKTYTFANSTAYTYFRLLITASGTGCDVAEVTINGVSNIPVVSAEMWVVVKSSDFQGRGSWHFGTDTQQNHYSYAGVIYDDFGNATRRSFTPTLDIKQWRIYRVTSNGTWTAYLDGVQQATAAAPATFTRAAYLGVGANGGTVFDGQIAEVIVRPAVSTAQEASDITAYLLAEHFPSSTSVHAAGSVDVDAGLAAALYVTSQDAAAADNFDRADTTTGLGAASDGSHAWATVAGGGVSQFRILGNAMQAISNTGPIAIAAIDPGAAAVTIDAVAKTVSSQSDTALAFRVQDGSNYWLIYAGGNGAVIGKWSIAKCSGGAFTFPLVTGLVAQNGDALRVILRTDNTIELLVNGVSQGAVLDSSFATATRVGFWQGTSAVSTYENLSITSAPAVPAYSGESDDFNRADTLGNLGRAPDGQPWVLSTDSNGVPPAKISGNRVAFVSTGSVQGILTLQAGMSDCIVQATMLTGGVQDCGIIGRATNYQNYWLAYAGRSSGCWSLFKMQTGTYTQMGSDSTKPVAAGDVARLVFNGSSVSLVVNGVTLITATDSFNQTATRHGLRTGTSPAGAMVDDFSVSTVAAPTLSHMSGVVDVDVALLGSLHVTAPAAGPAHLASSVDLDLALAASTLRLTLPPVHLAASTDLDVGMTVNFDVVAEGVVAVHLQGSVDVDAQLAAALTVVAGVVVHLVGGVDLDVTLDDVQDDLIEPPPNGGGDILLEVTSDVDITPTWVRVNVTNGAPGDTVELTVDDDPTVLLTSDLDETGQAIGISVPLPELAEGDHVLRTGVAEATFPVLNPPVAYPVARIPDVAPVPPTVARWALQDPSPGGVTYLFPINPSRMSSPHAARVFTLDHTTAPNGQPLTFEGSPVGVDFTFEGVVQTESFYDSLDAYMKAGRRLYLFDHLQRCWEISLEDVAWEPMRDREHPWAHRYKAKAIIYREVPYTVQEDSP